MIKTDLDVLVCPFCHGSLTLSDDAEVGKLAEDGFDEVVSGILHCVGRDEDGVHLSCGSVFPILDAIPVFFHPELAPYLKVTEVF
ncbi:MAG: hypothetical protein JW384_01414 [Nitrosomonadaceae bacterium]|nr:hypothetical protein [Nitrosomonadaceae bacterium]